MLSLHQLSYSNQTLEMTINKLEGYLRKKNTRLDIVSPDPDSGRYVYISLYIHSSIVK